MITRLAMLLMDAANDDHDSCLLMVFVLNVDHDNDDDFDADG